MVELSALCDAIITGQHLRARAITEAALAEGLDPLRLVHDFMIPAMDEVGRRFDCNAYFVPQLLLSARAMKASMELVRPLLASRGTAPIGRVVIGTVRGDLHDIGKNLVAAMLEGGGFEVHDLGVNVPAEAFVAKARDTHADIVGMSALLTTTMGAMKATIDALEAAGLRDRVKIMIGGAPVAQPFADEVGADGYCETAPGAVSLARRLIGMSA